MGRELLATSLRNLVRRCVHRSSKPPTRAATFFQSTQRWTESGRGRVSDFSLFVDKRHEVLHSGKQTVARFHSVTSIPRRKSDFCYGRRFGNTSEQNFEGREKISVTFVTKDGEEKKVQVPVGMSILEAAHENDIELEGACEGSLACSTCHVIVMEEEMYSRLPEPTDEENDMLDLAFGLTELSRLGCQVIAKPELDGLNVALPAATRNFAVDGHVPKPH